LIISSSGILLPHR